MLFLVTVISFCAGPASNRVVPICRLFLGQKNRILMAEFVFFGNSENAADM